MNIKRIGILVGGGPAPGTNGVISAVAIEAHKMGLQPIGFQDGFEWRHPVEAFFHRLNGVGEMPVRRERLEAGQFGDESPRLRGL